ncbi:UNVERIFIED_CONTAM: Nrsn1 [Trichonephila clavipes]
MRMNRGNQNLSETRIDMPDSNDEKQKILPKPIHKKEQKGQKKMRLEFEKTASLLNGDKLKNEYQLSDKSNNNDHTAISMEGLEESEKEESRPKFFGVRNYLHAFYETVNIKNPQLYEDIPDESETPEEPQKENRTCKLIWKIGITAGLIIVSIGLILILIGFITPLHPSVAEKNEEFLVIDKSATTFNDYMRMCRLVGVGMFIVGFSLFLAVVLLALCWNFDDGKNESEDEDSENVCLTFNPENTYQKGSDEKIPVTEELTTVQIKREKEDVVVTNSGLCAPSTLQIKTEK